MQLTNYVYMYVRIYIHIHVCMYACMYIHMYVCMHVCTHVCTYICTYVCIHMYVCMHVCMYVPAWEQPPRGAGGTPLGNRWFPPTPGNSGLAIVLAFVRSYTILGVEAYQWACYPLML